MGAEPLKNRFMRTCGGATLIAGPRKPITIRFENGRTHDMVLNKDTFCIGRQPTCEVPLNTDMAVSRIHLCVFNFPGRILVVDGWSLSGTVIEYGGGQVSETHAEGSLFVVPHGQPAALRIGSSRILINPC